MIRCDKTLDFQPSSLRPSDLQHPRPAWPDSGVCTHMLLWCRLVWKGVRGWKGAGTGLGALFGRANCGSCSCFSHTGIAHFVFLPLQGLKAITAGRAPSGASPVMPPTSLGPGSLKGESSVCLLVPDFTTRTPFSHTRIYPLSSSRPSTCGLALQRVQHPTCGRHTSSSE
jgi:hypothetical protein